MRIFQTSLYDGTGKAEAVVTTLYPPSKKNLLAIAARRTGRFVLAPKDEATIKSTLAQVKLPTYTLATWDKGQFWKHGSLTLWDGKREAPDTCRARITIKEIWLYENRIP